MPDPGGTRLVVLSDLHAHTGEPDPGGATSLSFHGQADGVAKMFDGLVATLHREGIRGVDAVVCPGDLVDRCNTTALPLVWERLCRLADELQATLVATAGNHDHLRQGGDSKQYLLGLDPPFPLRDETLKLEYFAYGSTRVDIARHPVLSVNSAGLTGLRDGKGNELYLHGSVSSQTVKWIQKSLDGRKPETVGVLVIHHHLVQLPSIDLNEASKIPQSEVLLEALAKDGSWLVIHGHKHRPWIQYAPGGGGSPVLFSAGSFAAPLNGVLAQSTKNQFYVLDLLSEDRAEELGLGPAGTFRAWSHSPLEDDVWVPSGQTDGLPARGGFGWRANPVREAARILREIAKRETDMSWLDMLAVEPRYEFVTPDDWAKFDKHVSRLSDNTIRVRRSSEGVLERVSYLVVDTND